MRGLFLAPSSAHVWGPGGCSAFPRMVAELPSSVAGPDALEGRAAHWWVDEAIKGRLHPAGTPTPHQLPVTDEMTRGGQTFVEDALKTIALGARWCAEASLQMPFIHPTLNKGRLDFGAYMAEGGVLHVREYKFGHRGVDAFENWQMVDYAIGLHDYLQLAPGDVKMLDLRVYQPRAFTAEGPVKRWVISADEFRGYADRLKQAAAAATDPTAPMTTGPHCRNCDARNTCPALRAAGGFALDVSLEGSAQDLTPSQAGGRLRLVRDAIARLQAIETGLSAQIEAAVRAGDLTTGFELVAGQGRTVWAVPAAEVMAMGKLFEVDLAKPPEPITPKQAEAKGLDASVISHYTKSQSGSMKLSPIDANAVKKAFQ